MDRFILPVGWTGVVSASRWRKPYGWCSHGEKLVTVIPPAWIPASWGIRYFFEKIIFNHEALHAWGSPGCSRPWCLGYEGKTWKEYLAMPLQLSAGLYFCDDCMAYYERGQMAARALKREV